MERKELLYTGKAKKMYATDQENVLWAEYLNQATALNGIKKDITAVKNGIIYSYNNGLAEGSVNKIKVIKRIMYGRNSFELLKAKVLFGELFHVKFN